MIYVTGDTHGNQSFWDACVHNILNDGDTIIVLGDFGIGFYDEMYRSEEMFYDYLAEQNYYVLFIDGNHENFDKLDAYPVEKWSGGRVHFIRRNVIHLMRGEIYNIDGKKVFCFGGGYSIDRAFRVLGRTWWPQEMPSTEEYRHATQNLEDCCFKVDYVLSHTAPTNTVEYMSKSNTGIRSTAKDELPLEGYLQWLSEKICYEKWYFGHFHIDAELWHNQYAVFDGIRELYTGKLIHKRC